MSSSDFWDTEHLSFKSLPSFQDLVRCCDEELLVRVILEAHALPAVGDKKPDQKRMRTARRRVRASLETMRNLSVRRKNSKARVFLPEESFVLRGQTNLIERRVGASLVSFSDLERALRAVRARRDPERDESAGPDKENELWPQRRSCVLAPWEKTLGTKVWLAGPWCRRERYLVLASVFWEMTYFGFEYDRVVARQHEEKARQLMGNTRVSADGQQVIGAAEWFGLREPDCFAEQYRDRLATCVGDLNDKAQFEFWLRFLDLARRIDKA